MANPLISLSHRAAHVLLQRPVTTSDLSRVVGHTGRSSGNPVDLAGKTVLITGASSGIGAAAARYFAAAQSHVVLVARNEEALASVAAELGATGAAADVAVADMSDTDDVARLIDHVVETHGCPDIVINNAGRSIRRKVLDATDRLHDYERTMAVNYFGPVALTLGLLPLMTERGSGHFINVSTWGVPMGAVPRFSAYAASKAAISAFGRTINIELNGTGVAVTTVYFPLVRTPMIAPTKAYGGLPALSTNEAAQWLTHAARYRDAEIMPRAARLMRRMSAVSSDISDGFVRHNFS